MTELIIGTRRSALARAQTRIVAQALTALDPGLKVIERPIATTGDNNPDSPLAALGGKGAFTRELELELMEGRIHMAVHSLKDLPTELPPGLELGAVLEREPPQDALIGPPGLTLGGLRPESAVGTGSLRRSAQLKRLRPDLAAKDIRGNIDTRIEKLDRGEYHALILALAGVRRLGRLNRIASVLESDRWFHAVGQGALAVEVREGDRAAAERVRALNHFPTWAEVGAERAMLRSLEGGCRAPVGVVGGFRDGRIRIEGMVCGEDGEPFITAEVSGPAGDFEVLGRELGQRLLDLGAAEIIARIRDRQLRALEGGFQS